MTDNNGGALFPIENLGDQDKLLKLKQLDNTYDILQEAIVDNDKLPIDGLCHFLGMAVMAWNTRSRTVQSILQLRKPPPNRIIISIKSAFHRDIYQKLHLLAPDKKVNTDIYHLVEDYKKQCEELDLNRPSCTFPSPKKNGLTL